jgi:cell division protein FtsW
VVSTLTVWMVGQATINIGYVVGLLPVTGIPLPLVSSGGSALVTAMFVGGLLANAARHEPEAIAALRTHGQGRVARLLGLRLPEPYRSPGARAAPRAAAPSPRTPRDARPPAQRSSSSGWRAGSGRRGAQKQVPGQRDGGRQVPGQRGRR